MLQLLDLVSMGLVLVLVLALELLELVSMRLVLLLVLVLLLTFVLLFY